MSCNLDFSVLSNFVVDVENKDNCIEDKAKRKKSKKKNKIVKKKKKQFAIVATRERDNSLLFYCKYCFKKYYWFNVCFKTSKNILSRTKTKNTI